MIYCKQAAGWGNSTYRGVHWDKEKSRWAAQIGGKSRTRQRRLGRYRTEEEAARAYDVAAVEEYGEKAIINFPASPCTEAYSL